MIIDKSHHHNRDPKLQRAFVLRNYSELGNELH
jgi:hypothetical protein